MPSSHIAVRLVRPTRHLLLLSNILITAVMFVALAVATYWLL